MSNLSSNDDPKKEQDKIIKYQEQLKIKYQTCLSKFERLLNRYKTQYNEQPYNLTPDQCIKSLNEKLILLKQNKDKFEKLNTNLAVLKEKQRVNINQKKQIETLTAQRDRANVTISSNDSSLLDQSLETLENNLNLLGQQSQNLKQQQLQYTKYINLKSKLTSVSSNVNIEIPVNVLNDL